ncbi:MAG: helix-turn-helix transcriptional regulator [Pseudomonadota bacterium]
MNDERAANAIDRRLGQRVRTRRLEIGMSQERLAELLGVTFQQVQKYEKGVNRIAASRLFDISAALDMTIARFFEGLNPTKGARGVAEEGNDFIHDALATPEGAQLMSLFASIKSVKVRRRVVELVRALAEEEAEKSKKG